MTVFVIGTCDTKGAELRFLRDAIAAAGVPVRLVDVSTGPVSAHAPGEVTPAEVLAALPPGDAVDRADRGAAVGEMARALVRWLGAQGAVAGVLGIGGSGGTALIAPALRALPLGVPKMLVSTVASGNVAPYVGSSDILMLSSVADLSGLNRISRPILANAAAAMAGMARAERGLAATDRPAVALTMFGVTTPCVTAVMQALSDSHDPLVFHATGTGGQTFETLVDQRLVAAGIDVTTTEVADHLVGGVFPCTDDRFGAFIRTGVPWVGSVGALDMVNFGARETVPAAFRDRRFHVHNANVTLMRTTPDENIRIGRWIAARLNQCAGPVHLLLPEGGVSAIDAAGLPFWDPEADAALFAALEATLRPGPQRRIERLALHINDPAFAAALVARTRALL